MLRQYRDNRMPDCRCYRLAHESLLYRALAGTRRCLPVRRSVVIWLFTREGWQRCPHYGLSKTWWSSCSLNKFVVRPCRAL